AQDLQEPVPEQCVVVDHQHANDVRLAADEVDHYPVTSMRPSAPSRRRYNTAALSDSVLRNRKKSWPSSSICSAASSGCIGLTANCLVFTIAGPLSSLSSSSSSSPRAPSPFVDVSLRASRPRARF